MRETRSEWRDCGDVDPDDVTWFHPGRGSLHFVKDRGEAFVSSSSFGIPGVSLTLSTQNSSTNSHVWAFPPRADTPADYYCLAGVDGEWHDASEVYAGAHYPHGH